MFALALKPLYALFKVCDCIWNEGVTVICCNTCTLKASFTVVAEFRGKCYIFRSFAEKLWDEDNLTIVHGME